MHGTGTVSCPAGLCLFALWVQRINRGLGRQVRTERAALESQHQDSSAAQGRGSTRKPESKTRYPVRIYLPTVFLSGITPYKKIEFIQIVPFASLVRIQ